MIGMDVESVQMLENALNNAASEIQAITANISKALDETVWVGTDRNTFQSDWDGTHVPQLRQLAEVLTNVAARARYEIEQQEEKSRT